jgi:hypothetical protein
LYGTLFEQRAEFESAVSKTGNDIQHVFEILLSLFDLLRRRCRVIIAATHRIVHAQPNRSTITIAIILINARKNIHDLIIDTNEANETRARKDLRYRHQLCIYLRGEFFSGEKKHSQTQRETTQANNVKKKKKKSDLLA